MAITYMTYVTSKTWDEVRNKSYPDKYEVERDLAEIDRLISEGHKITVIMDHTPIEFNRYLFDNIMFGLHPEYKRTNPIDSASLNADINTGVNNTTTDNNKKENKSDKPGPKN